MGRRKGKGRGRQANTPDGQGDGDAGQQQQRQSEYQQPSDPPRAVLAVNPQGGALAVAVGPELRVYDTQQQKLHVLVSKPEESQQQQQQGKGKQQATVAPIIRGLAFDASGRYLLAGSEDKAAGLRLWDCATWELLQSIKVPKKVTTCAFTVDGRHMLAADKFGDVLAAATQRPEGLPEGQAQEPEIMLGHYCAILTSLSLSANGRLLATTDRDQRVRVSIVPADPMAGAHEIQSLCFGHTTFVTCSAFVHQGSQELLVSGGGDGTLRLWDPLSGELLHTLELPPLLQPTGEQGGDVQTAEQQAAGNVEGQEEEDAEEGGASSDDEAGACAGGAAGSEGAAADAAIPLALAASPDGGWVVAAVDGRDELCLVQLDWQARQLREAAWCALPGLHLPACLAFEAGGRLWVAGGPVADDSTAAFLACATVEAAAGAAPRLAPADLPAWLPADGAAELQALTGGEAAALAAVAERRRLASQLLRKRQYDPAEREARKRRRRDRTAQAAAGESGAAAAQDA